MKTILEAAANLCGGRFRLSSVVGQGPFATVYEALDQSTGRTCAVKRMDRPLTREPLWAALQRDAALVAQAGSPGILVPFAAGVDERGCGYLAAELIPGQAAGGASLGERLRGGALPPAAALELIEAVAARLEAAAGVGVCHGDLKPSNVLLGPDRAVWLCDFGFGHLAAAGLPSGDAYGYQPPEWFQPGAHRPSVAADVYGLGLLVFECLTGRPLYTPLSQAEARRLLCEDPFPHLAMLPERQRELVALACARDPRARFAGPLAVARALRSTLETARPARGPVEAASDAPPPRETEAELRLPPAVAQARSRNEALRAAVMAPDPAPTAGEPPRERQTLLYHGGRGGSGDHAPGDGVPGAVIPLAPEEAERARTLLWASRPPELKPPAAKVPEARGATRLTPATAALAKAPPAGPAPPAAAAATISGELETEAERAATLPYMASRLRGAPAQAEVITAPVAAPPIAGTAASRGGPARPLAEDPRAAASHPQVRAEPRPAKRAAPPRGAPGGRRPAGKRRLWLALLGGLLGVGAVGIYMARSAGLILRPRIQGQPRGKGPTAPKRPSAEQELLQEAQSLLERREYAAAMGRTDLVLRNNPLQPEALALRRRAREGMNELVLCERLLRAIKRSDLENAATLLPQLPADSPCRSEVRAAVAEQVPQYEEAHARLLRAAQQARRCDEVAAEVQRMQAFSSRPADAVQKEAERIASLCRDQRPGKAPPASLPVPFADPSKDPAK